MSVKPIRTFNVVPNLPPVLEGLRELAYNLRWCWNHDAVELFQRLDPERWQTTHHNPVLLLGGVEQDRLDAAASDEGFLAHLRQVLDDFAHYQSDEHDWFAATHGRAEGPMVAYFSAEFGITECLPIFAGGLGLLAGDHLKSASDLGVPLVGVGLLYQQGYFQQRLNEAGWQEHLYVANDFHALPLTLVETADGAPLTIETPFPERVSASANLAGSRRVAWRCICWTPTSAPTTRPTAPSPVSSMGATSSCASSRSSCWASADAVR